MNEHKKTLIVLIILLLLLPIVFILGIMLGSESISMREICASLLSTKKDEIDFSSIIIKDIRLPRTILALLCGALLAGAGAIFQGFFRSPLADSSMLGVSSGAALGAIIGGLLNLWIPVTSFSGALLSIIIVFIISGGKRTASEPVRLLLAGSAISVFFTSLSSAILLIKDKELYKIYVWTLGSFNGKNWDELKFILIPTFFSFTLFLFCIKPLDIIASGDLTAQALGLSLKKTRILCFVAGSLASASAVCAGGVIGFIGLVSPHIIRILCGNSYKRIIPLSILFGGILLCIVDILSRTINPPLDIPVGILTSLIGAPFFVFILIRHNRRFVL